MKGKEERGMGRLLRYDNEFEREMKSVLVKSPSIYSDHNPCVGK